LEVQDNIQMRSEHGNFPVPLRVILKEYVALGGRYWRQAPLNNATLFLRDGHTCQYCGRGASALKRGERLTRDHVLPRSRGGADTWENVVAACSSCNHRKADRLPSEAGLTLLSQPKRPRVAQTMMMREDKQRRAMSLDTELAVTGV